MLSKRSLTAVLFSCFMIVKVQAENTPSTQALAAGTALGLPNPAQVAGAVQRDKAAVAELSAFGQLTTPTNSELTSVRGSMTIGEPSSARIYTAAMLVGEHGRFRLDVHSPEEESLRAFGVKAEDSRGESKPKPAPMSVFMSAYVFGVTAQHLLSDPSVSIVDHGVAEENGQGLHKISVCKPGLSPLQSPECGDLYLDPATHLLTYSVVMIPLHGSSSLRVKRVIQYDNYSEEQGAMMAHRFIESNNGQIGTTFEANSISLNSTKDDSQFHF